MKATLTNSILLSELTHPETKAIKQRCTFRNPKYAEAIAKGRSVRNIDVLIQLYQETEDGLIIPIGLLNSVPRATIDDQRNTHSVVIPFNGELRAYQKNFIIEGLKAQGGVMVAATGAGKTVSAIALAVKLQQRALILVKSKDLAEQWLGAIKQFTGLDSGLIGNGKSSQGKQFTIGLVQSLVKCDLSELDYGLVIADECHSTPANQCYNVITGINARYKYGLSATPQRRDNLEMMIFAALGPICSEIKPNQLQGKVLPVNVHPIRFPFFGRPESWSEFIANLSRNEDRNHYIVDLARVQTRPTIILCSTVAHCEILATLAAEARLKPLLIHGQLPAKDRTARMEQAQTSNLIIGTNQLLGEGLDLPHLENLIFASPMSASIAGKATPAATKLIQSIGRCRRPFPGKTHAVVYDFVDKSGFGIAAWKKRQHIYQLQGFSVAL